MEDEYETPDEAKIPAATIADVDLLDIAEQTPEVYAEIIRLDDLLGRGDETPEEFRLLCQLLFNHGKVAKAEYLLRRNLEEGDENHALYLRLFGRAREQVFLRAIEDFQTAFNANLLHKESYGFLHRMYELESYSVEEAPFSVFADESCEVYFDYSEEDAVTAEVDSLESDRYVTLQWIGGKWIVTDQSDA
jgi:hypothetical protein